MSTRYLLLLFANILIAADPLGAAGVKISLDDALTEALTSGHGLQALNSTAEAAGHEARAAQRQRWGTLNAVASYRQLQDDVIIRPISSELLAEGFSSLPFDDRQWSWGVVAEVPLYLGGKLSNSVKISELSSERSRAQLQGATWQVRFNIVSLYTTTQSLDAIYEALGHRLAALEATNSRLELMVSEGKRPDIDRLKVVEELENVRSKQVAVQANRHKVCALLLSLMGRDPSDDIFVDPLPEVMPERTVEWSELSAMIDETSAVRQARIALSQASSNVKIATSEYMPKVLLRGNYMENDGRSLDRTYNTWAVSVDMVVPLFHGGARPEQRAAAKLRRQAAEHFVEKARLEVMAELKDAMAEFEATKTSIQAAKARVDAGSEAARIEQIRFNTGAGTVEDLLRAQAREEEALSDLAGARARALTAGAQINSIVEREVIP